MCSQENQTSHSQTTLFGCYPCNTPPESFPGEAPDYSREAVLPDALASRSLRPCYCSAGSRHQRICKMESWGGRSPANDPVHSAGTDSKGPGTADRLGAYPPLSIRSYPLRPALAQSASVPPTIISISCRSYDEVLSEATGDQCCQTSLGYRIPVPSHAPSTACA